jgi:ribosomal protein S18 acetylase RimI-like enzyme
MQGEIARLTRRGTAETYLADGLGQADLAFIQHVIDISTENVLAAATDDHRFLATAFVEGRLAGFVIATAHAPDDRELDWLFVDPDHHGTGVARELMRAGMDWLGTGQSMWLSVARHNQRAIAFYAKYGFVIDCDATPPHIMPHFIMRRMAS